MRVMICCVILTLCLPLVAGTFIPLCSFEDARIFDFDLAFEWGTMLNLGNCVYEEDLWYNGGMNDSYYIIPPVHIQKGLTENMQIGLQAFSLYADFKGEHQALFVRLNLKHLLSESEDTVVSINPTVGYSKNHFIPSTHIGSPYLWQSSDSKQDSQAFSAQLPLLLHLKKPGINCCAKLGYSHFAAKASHMVKEHDQELALQDFSYGPHNIFNAGVNVNYPIRLGWFRICPEIGYEVFSLIKHEDKFAGSVTGGLALSFVWPK